MRLSPIAIILVTVLVTKMSASSPQQASMPTDAYVTSEGIASTFFDFYYPFPKSFAPDTKTLEGMLWKQQKLSWLATSSILVSAFSEHPAPGERNGVIIVAHRNARVRTRDSAAAYETTLTTVLAREGWKIVRGPVRYNAAKHEFFRSDFTNTRVFESSVCISLRGYILEFLFIGKSRDEVNTLVGSLDRLRFQDQN